ncbi:hypothetical protein Tsubulata_024020 [Turnera subulata]|uniref:Uncharacterized protein n=1 Tax=Turnera subulata TaxID=218843 RepID=A0A9Q0GJ58_9ROSI|nr:hypothetical protein Tsubulata_024020 [Turnera subulata]
MGSGGLLVLAPESRVDRHFKAELWGLKMGLEIAWNMLDKKKSMEHGLQEADSQTLVDHRIFDMDDSVLLSAGGMWVIRWGRRKKLELKEWDDVWDTDSEEEAADWFSSAVDQAQRDELIQLLEDSVDSQGVKRKRLDEFCYQVTEGCDAGDATYAACFCLCDGALSSNGRACPQVQAQVHSMPWPSSP